MIKKIFFIFIFCFSLTTLPGCYTVTKYAITDNDLTTLIGSYSPEDVETYKELRKLGFSKAECIRLLSSLYDEDSFYNH